MKKSDRPEKEVRACAVDTLTEHQRFQNYILTSKNLVFFTGAGISTDSGISDYRSQGGLWDRFTPVTIQEFIDNPSKRREYWRRKLELYKSFSDVKPNKGHLAIAEFEQIAPVKGVITQNIDGLHQLAGTKAEHVVEIHGSNRETICLSCEVLTSWEETCQRLESGEEAPTCHKCGGLLKPNTISFGQRLNAETLDRAVQLAANCDLMIVVGSTLLVEPAASLPRIAKRNGAALVIITLSETPLDSIADIKFEASASDVLSRAVADCHT